MTKYKEKFKLLYPNFTDKQLEKVIELRIKFWTGIVDNFDLFYKSID